MIPLFVGLKVPVKTGNSVVMLSRAFDDSSAADPMERNVGGVPSRNALTSVR